MDEFYLDGQGERQVAWGNPMDAEDSWDFPISGDQWGAFDMQSQWMPPEPVFAPSPMEWENHPAPMAEEQITEQRAELPPILKPVISGFLPHHPAQLFLGSLCPAVSGKSLK